MRIGIPKEIYPGERRVAATPMTVAKMRKLGLEVLVQAGAGEASDYADGLYIETGATIVPDAAALWEKADLVLKVRPPQAFGEGDAHHEADLLREGAALIGFIWPGQNPSLVERLNRRRATVLSMDAVPRITRAQKMDALSAMANIVGYRSVLEAASALGRFLGGQMTAAGRVPPAKVLVLGAGVAGLAAIACAKSLGAVVRAFDTRPAVREQVESLGATFVEMPEMESGEGEGGYAKEMSPAFIAAEQALIAQNCESSDVVICTALVPGKPAPLLVTSGAVVSMPQGSVIVDLAAEQGGNCALTERDRAVEKFGVKVLGYTDLASRMARQSSDLYATTAFNLLADVLDEKATKLDLDMEDEIHR
ncbi:MAG TPA: Re/Si-specific NAD(P)(+) transhydrogenase subunit alpha, partial [Polyangiaceae bacterium]